MILKIREKTTDGKYEEHFHRLWELNGCSSSYLLGWLLSMMIFDPKVVIRENYCRCKVQIMKSPYRKVEITGRFEFRQLIVCWRYTIEKSSTLRNPSSWQRWFHNSTRRLKIIVFGSIVNKYGLILSSNEMYLLKLY